MKQLAYVGVGVLVGIAGTLAVQIVQHEHKWGRLRRHAARRIAYTFVNNGAEKMDKAMSSDQMASISRWLQPVVAEEDLFRGSFTQPRPSNYPHETRGALSEQPDKALRDLVGD